MTKQEFIKELEQFPNNAEILMFDEQRLCWRTPSIYLNESSVWEHSNGSEVKNFIGLE